MKYAISFLVAVLLAAGAAIYYTKARSLQASNQALAAEKAAAEEKARLLEAEKVKAEEQGQKLVALADELGERLATRNTALSNQVAEKLAEAAASAAGSGDATNKGGGLGKMISNLMSDPDTRGFIREQQRMMMDQLYAPLTKRLNMTPEESAGFKELVLDNMMKGAEKGMAMFDGSTTNRQEMMKTMAEEQKRFDEDVRAFLGESRYQQYKDYSLTLQERAQLNMFKQMDPSGAAGFNEEQTERLLAVMAEEKQKGMAGMASAGNQEAMAMEAIGSEDGMRKLLEIQEGVNARVYERASEMLNANQLSSFGRFQTNQLQQMRMGLSMARKMFQQ